MSGTIFNFNPLNHTLRLPQHPKLTVNFNSVFAPNILYKEESDASECGYVHIMYY